MRAVVTRVSWARVRCQGETTGEIGPGFLVLLGIGVQDGPEQAEWMADRVAGLRIFEDENGKMNRSLAQVSGSVLVVSNFTLYADCSSRRPGFTQAARPEQALPLYQHLIDALRKRGVPVEQGVFGGDMAVESLNDGPITILLDTERKK